MDAGKSSILALFEPKLRLEVPLFQRQYVWSEDEQWRPLWEDIARKFTEYLEGRTDAPIHFLGAMVLDQKLTPTTHVVRRQVIDGQQRLTTFRLFLAAFRDFCADNDCQELADECKKYTLNSGMMANPDVDRFKVWPTLTDRTVFSDVMLATSRSDIETSYPLTKKKYARRYDPRPRMVEAYLFFYERIEDFFVGDEDGDALLASTALSLRLEECFNALKNALQVVVIDLGPEDDPQVIFETLNARGQPLLPADLLRNYIFLRAGRLNENQEALYEEYWSGFDDGFWRKEIRQGRLSRPRSDLFMQHFLASRLSADISAKHLYVEYKHWIERHTPFESIQAELSTLKQQRGHFRRIVAPETNDSIAAFSGFLEAFEVSTLIPLMLTLMESDVDEIELDICTTALESYILRRAVCGLTNKNYNRIFLSLNRLLRSAADISSRTVVEYLLSLTGESSNWPTDAAFRAAWFANHMYRLMNAPKIVHVLRRINDELVTSLNEDVQVNGPLTVEHVMPQAWIEHWPLADGSRGLPFAFDDEESQPEPAYKMSRERDNLIHTMGNLTILTGKLNSTTSNGSWIKKREAIQNNSLLPINLYFNSIDVWDESSIKHRSDTLFERAIEIWPRG